MKDQVTLWRDFKNRVTVLTILICSKLVIVIKLLENDENVYIVLDV